MNFSRYKIYVQRTCELEAPFDICEESSNDWTHFTHLHRKAIVGYRLLNKKGLREVFLYKARVLYPLPFYDHYVIFRNYEPQQNGYKNVYLNVRTGQLNYLSGYVIQKGKSSLLMADYLFNMSWYWRFFPGFFLWVFRRRMRSVMDEDNQWIYERMKQKEPYSNKACAPVVPEEYDLFKDLFKDDIFKHADIRMDDYSKETFDGKGRFKIKETAPLP